MTQEEIKDIALCGETSTVQFKVTVWRTLQKNDDTHLEILSGKITDKETDKDVLSGKSTQKTADSTQESTQKTADSTQKNTGSTQKRIVDAIKENPYISRREIAEKVGITEDGVKKQLANMKRTGVIERIGADKGGYWSVVNPLI